MALRFHSEFSNIRREVFKIEIYDSSFSGSSTEFIVRGNGFNLSYNGGEETYQLIKSSTLSFVMNVDNSTLRGLPNDIAASSDSSRFGVKVYKDDTYTAGNNYTPDGSNYVLYWYGCINKRIMTVEDSSYPFDFKISAVDGIELLKLYTYNDVSNNFIFEDRISVVGFLVKIIDRLDIANILSATDTVLATRVNWYETNHALTDSVAAKTYMYESVFNSVGENGEVELSTYYDVLKHICDIFQCRFMLYEGKFWYTQFSRLKETSNSYYLYKLNGTAASPSTITKTINDIKGEVGGAFATGGSADGVGDQLLTNNNFTTNLNDWVVTPATSFIWVSNSGIGGAASVGTFGVLGQNGVLQTATTYNITITVTGRTTGFFFINAGGAVSPSIASNGTSTFTLTTTSGTNFTVIGVASWNGIVSNVTCEQQNQPKPGFYLRNKTFGEKLTSVKIKWNGLSNGTQNLLPLSYFPVWQFPNATWQPYGQNSNGPNLSGYFEDGDNISFKINIKFSIRVSRIDNVSTTSPFYGKIVFPFWILAKDDNNVATANRWWRANGTGSPTGVILPTPEDEGFIGAGSWLYDANTFNQATKFKTGVVYLSPSEDEEIYYFDVTINTGVVPVAEVSGLFFYNDYSGGWDSALGNGDWFAVENPTTGALLPADDSAYDGYSVEPIFDEDSPITIAPYQNGEPFIGSTVDSYVSEDAADSINPENLIIDTIKWGDGPNAVGVRTIWVDDGTNIIQSNLWQRNNTGSTFKIHKLITEEILNFNYISGERLNGTIYQSPNLFETQTLNLSEGFDRDYKDEEGVLVENELYAFSSLFYNPQLASWGFKGRKISLSVPTVTTTEPQDPDNEPTERAINPLTNSVNSLHDEDSSCKLNQQLSPSASATSITVTPITSDLSSGSVLLIQSANSDRKWEQITLSASASKLATTLSINSFTPSYAYDTTSRIILSRTTLAATSGGGGSSTDTIQILLKDFGSFLFYLFQDDNWYSAGSSTLAVLGTGTSPSNIPLSVSQNQSRIAAYTAINNCTLKKLVFTFYWSSSVVNSADVDFAFSKFTPITDGTQAIITMNPITATDKNGTYNENKPYQCEFVFSGSNASLTAGDAFAFHMRTTGSTTQTQRVFVYGTAVLSVEISGSQP
tara:strand:- start:995 stop:4417 length:3423 start_codon:yes stop_codon:yes gene_type:complete